MVHHRIYKSPPPVLSWARSIQYEVNLHSKKYPLLLLNPMQCSWHLLTFDRKVPSPFSRWLHILLDYGNKTLLWNVICEVRTHMLLFVGENQFVLQRWPTNKLTNKKTDVLNFLHVRCHSEQPLDVLPCPPPEIRSALPGLTQYSSWSYSWIRECAPGADSCCV